jgi:CBS domain-containing protein
MLIEHILATKGRDVIVVGRSDTVAEIVAVLKANRIGAVIVSDDGGATVSGIVSERDVVNALADDGANALDLRVEQVMTADVFTCDPSASLQDLMATMTERRIRHIPVVADGRLVGVVSIGDVVKHRVGELAQEAQTLHDYVNSGR